ncbi:glutaredoxin family protein [Bacillus testis]|uniref:glutaredoxin family protein n=1 Tax=Bacillus testis TaxID=1622072 RepID=UPI00067EA232|nr:glutaredoxin domain-containing protein [Bacillus testis]
MNKVVVYTQPSCPPCEFTKLFLKEHGVPFEEKNIARDQKAKKKMMNQYNAFSTPVIVIDEEAIIGFDQEKIERLLHL